MKRAARFAHPIDAWGRRGRGGNGRGIGERLEVSSLYIRLNVANLKCAGVSNRGSFAFCDPVLPVVRTSAREEV